METNKATKTLLA